MPKPRILMLHRQQSAVGYYRTWVPARYLAAQGYEVEWFESAVYKKAMRPTPQDYLKKKIAEKAYDLLWVDRSLDWDELGLFAGAKHYLEGSRMIVDFDDDFTHVPWWNPTHGKYQPGQIYHQVGKCHLKMAELCTVSTQTLLEEFQKSTHDIVCTPNSIDPEDWIDLPVDPDRERDPRLRVLYGGANGHFGDLDAVREGLEAAIRNPPTPWLLVCFGAVPSWIHEIHREFPERVAILPWVPFRDYPQAVAWGGFDAALAPLTEHRFNKAKSNIKWLEAGIQKIPLICSKVGPYADIPGDCAFKVENTAAQWAQALKIVLTDKDLRKQVKERTFKEVMDGWTISVKGNLWEEAIERALKAPRITSLEDTRLPSEPKAVNLTPPSESPGTGA